MGLRDEIENELLPALLNEDELADAYQPFVLISKGERVWDKDAGKYVSAAIKYNCQGIFSSYKDYQVDGDVVQTRDQKLKIIRSQLNTEPKVNDEILYEDKTYRIVNVGTDPIKLMWSLQLRDA